MPWKNKHQQRLKLFDVAKQNADQNALTGPTANVERNKIPPRGVTKQCTSNGGSKQENVSYGRRVPVGLNGHAPPGQRTSKHQEHIFDRTQHRLSSSHHSNAVSRQDYKMIQQKHRVSTPDHAEIYAQQIRYDQQRRSVSPGRDSEAYLRQQVYHQQKQQQQVPVSPGRFREAQMRHMEYQRQRQRSVSPQKNNRAHSHTLQIDYPPQQRSISPSRMREEQLRKVAHQKLLQKQQEQQNTNPSNRVHYTSEEFSNSSQRHQQTSSDGRSRNDADLRRTQTCRDRNISDGAKEGGTLTREQRRLLIQQQLAFKATTETNPLKQKEHYSRDSYHEPKYLDRGQRSRSQQHLNYNVREVSKERRRAASVINESPKHVENRQQNLRSASLDRNLEIHTLLNDSKLQNRISESHANLERPSQPQIHRRQPARSPDDRIQPNIFKAMQKRVPRRSKSPGATEAEKQLLSEDLRRNANQQAGTQLKRSTNTAPGDDTQVAWQNAIIELKSSTDLDDKEFLVNMINHGMTVVKIPCEHTVIHVDVHQEEPLCLSEKASDASVPQLVTFDTRANKTRVPPARPPRSPRHTSSETHAAKANNSLSHRSSRTVSSYLEPAPIPPVRRSRSKNRNHNSKNTHSPPNSAKHCDSRDIKQPDEELQELVTYANDATYQEEQVLSMSRKPSTLLKSKVHGDTRMQEQHKMAAFQPTIQDLNIQKLCTGSLPISQNSQFQDLGNTHAMTAKIIDDTSQPVPKPRRPRSKRSTRKESSKRKMLTNSEEQVAKNEDISNSPEKEPSSSSKPKVLSSKALFHHRRHSRGLDNRMQNHSEPLTIPEPNGHKHNDAIVCESYERRSSLSGRVSHSLTNNTQPVLVNEIDLCHDHDSVSRSVPEKTDTLAPVQDSYNNQEQLKHKISGLMFDQFDKRNPLSTEIAPVKQESIKDKSAVSLTKDLPVGDELQTLTGSDHPEPVISEDILISVKYSDQVQLTHEMNLAEPDRIEHDEEADGENVVSTQKEFANDENNESVISTVKETETQYYLDDLTSTDILNSSNSQSSVHVLSNSSFTSKSSNEHEFTDSFSDSTGSYMRSPLTGDRDKNDIPVPPPRYRKRQTKSTRRKNTPESNSSESRTREAEYDCTGETQSREDEDRLPGLGVYPHVRKTSLSGERALKYTKEQIGSVTGLRGFTSPTFHRKAKDKRRQQKMLPSPGGHSNRMPRQPRPQRMQTIMEALKSGLKDSIKLNRERMQGMQQHQNDEKAARTRQEDLERPKGFHYNLDKQVKVAERYLRKLQFHLAKVEELQEQYEKELKVREGAVNMVKAYSGGRSSHAKEPVSEAKLGVKDCTQALCAMEAELEANLGAFVIKIEGIAGFARVCRGDIFEIGFKLGFQKFKSKCKVEKDLSQSWEGEEILLYPMVADFLTIKVTEIRGIARSNVVIGNLEFDTSDFYQAEPQNLTIDVNDNGTIKLNVVATWSPFHIDEEELRSPNKNSYHKRERAFTDGAITPGKNFHSDTPRSQSLRERSAPKPIDLGTNLVLTLEEAMHNVTRLLEILNGQYGELKTLEHNVEQLNTMLKEKTETKKRESIVSLSVKSALESFDFLNEVDETANSDYEDSGSGSMEETNRRNTLDSTRSDSVISAGTDSTCSIEIYTPPQKGIDSHTNKQTDSNQQNLLPERPIQRRRGNKFIEMSEKRESRLLELNEQRGSKLFETLDKLSKKDGGENSDMGSALTCDNEHIDTVLVQHLMYIEYLLSHLGAFGPLKLKETTALEKLHKQAVIIEQLMALCMTKIEITSAPDILPNLKLNLPLLEFWEMCAETEVLYVKADDFLLQLDVKFGAKLRTDHPDIADNVFQSLCHRLVDRPVDLLSPKTIITLFQYITFFAEEGRKHPEKFITDLTEEFELTASLEPGNPDLPKLVKQIPKGAMLPTGNLRALSLLLLEDSATVQTGVRMYYESISTESSVRQKVITVYLECLEERDQSLRQAGCAALAAMKATESLDQLVYLLRCDVDDVKTTAKVALMAFGDKGRLAYEQISFASYGDYPPYPVETTTNTPIQTTEL